MAALALAVMRRKRTKRSSATSRFPTGPLKSIAALKAFVGHRAQSTRAETNDRVYDGLRKAGMPEG